MGIHIPYKDMTTLNGITNSFMYFSEIKESVGVVFCVDFENFETS